MKIVFLGTPMIAVPSLKLISEYHDVLAVVTQPDKVQGRGREIKFSPVKELALSLGIRVLQPVSIKEEAAIKEIEDLNADLIVVAAYAQKIPLRILNIGKGCINMHPSLLPKYRGAAPVRGPILNGDRETGVTIMYVAEQFDSGDMILQETMTLDPKETCASLEPKLAKKGAEMLLEAVNRIEAGTVKATPQNHSESTYYSQITKEEGRIDFCRSAEFIERQIRACNPWPSAFTILNGKTFKIWDADALPEAQNGKNEAARCGEIVCADKKNLFVKCGPGILKINEVQLEGKKRMTTEEFLRGKKINTGEIFG